MPLRPVDFVHARPPLGRRQPLGFTLTYAVPGRYLYDEKVIGETPTSSYREYLQRVLQENYLPA